MPTIKKKKNIKYKICEKCEYYKIFAIECIHPSNLKIDLRTGNEETIRTITDMRSPGRLASYLFKACGISGRYYLPKDKKEKRADRLKEIKNS